MTRLIHSFEAWLQPLYDAQTGASPQDEALDRGGPLLNDATAALRTFGRGDGRIQSFELLRDPDRIASSYASVFGANLPWSIDGAASSLAVQDFDGLVAGWRGSHPRASLRDRTLLESCVRWVVSPSGLGMVYEDGTPERAAEDVLNGADRRVDCTEFAMVLIGLLTRAGFEAQPVWVARDVDGDEVQHVALRVQVQGGSVVIDPVYGSFESAHLFDPPHVTSVDIPRSVLLSWHWINRGSDLRDAGCYAEAEQAYRRAEAIDPFNPHLFLNRGISRGRWGLTERRAGRAAQADRLDRQALSDFASSLHIRPTFHHAEYSLGNFEYDRGRLRAAVAHYRRAIALAPQEVQYRADLHMALSELRSR